MEATKQRKSEVLWINGVMATLHSMAVELECTVGLIPEQRAVLENWLQQAITMLDMLIKQIEEGDDEDQI